jgi:hypothetical protein
MGRRLRYVPPRSLVEVTLTTVHRRFLLRPSRDLLEITHGLVARCARLYAVDVVDYVFFSNHAHLLLVPRDSPQGGAPKEVPPFSPCPKEVPLFSQRACAPRFPPKEVPQGGATLFALPQGGATLFAASLRSSFPS